MAAPTIFFLGATGFVGGEVLLVIARDHPEYRIRALLRDATPQRVDALKALHPGIEVVEGLLEDDQVIQNEVERADIVINTASSDHWASVKSTLAGLEKNSAKNPGKPPLYIHTSGCGIISDNVRGEKVDYVREWTDIGLDLKDCPPDNTHLESDSKIVEAGTRAENPVRTIILFPGQIYGIGEGVQRTTLWVRVFLDVAKNAGRCGTWGPGEISQSNIHVKDMATAIATVLDAALQGKALEGADGLYFAVSPAPLVTYHDWSVMMGDILYKKGLVKESGARPFPPEFTDPWGHYGWSLLASNQRARPDKLMQLGWKPEYSAKMHLRDVFPAMVEAALGDYEVQAKFAFR